MQIGNQWLRQLTLRCSPDNAGSRWRGLAKNECRGRRQCHDATSMKEQPWRARVWGLHCPSSDSFREMRVWLCWNLPSTLIELFCYKKYIIPVLIFEPQLSTSDVRSKEISRDRTWSLWHSNWIEMIDSIKFVATWQNGNDVMIFIVFVLILICTTCSTRLYYNSMN